MNQKIKKEFFFDIKKVKELRSKLNISQKELAKKINVVQSTISRIEKGKSRSKLELLKRIFLFLEKERTKRSPRTNKRVLSKIERKSLVVESGSAIAIFIYKIKKHDCSWSYFFYSILSSSKKFVVFLKDFFEKNKIDFSKFSPQKDEKIDRIKRICFLFEILERPAQDVSLKIIKDEEKFFDNINDFKDIFVFFKTRLFLSQEGLSRILSLSQTTISRLESGKKEVSKRLFLVALRTLYQRYKNKRRLFLYDYLFTYKNSGLKLREKDILNFFKILKKSFKLIWKNFLQFPQFFAKLYIQFSKKEFPPFQKKE